MTLTRTRSSVIERAKAGDGDDLARLYGPLAYAIAQKAGLNVQEAQDVAQQSMVELFRMLPGFAYDRDRGSFKGLVWRVVTRQVQNLWRRRRRERLVDLDPVVLESESAVMDTPWYDREWLKAHLVAAMDEVRNEVLPSTFQSFQLTELDGIRVKEAARMLGLSANQVSQNRRRVMARLRERLAHLLPEFEG